MGQLILDALSSFAQLEHEIAAERIRDNIAASKKRGHVDEDMPSPWFDVESKQLVISGAEAIDRHAPVSFATRKTKIKNLLDFLRTASLH